MLTLTSDTERELIVSLSNTELHKFLVLRASGVGISDLNYLENNVPYILEYNPHPFYSFRGLKNQMRIRIACGLDSRSRAGFWKNDRAAVRAIRTIQ